MTNKKTGKNSHKTDLILIFMIPIVVMALAMAAIFFQRAQANPKYSFIYAACSSYGYCNLDYKYDEFGYISSFQTSDYVGDYDLYLYDVNSGESTPLSLYRAGNYKLDDSEKSPDGYVLSDESDGMRFLFWSDNSDQWFLQNGSKKKLVELNGASRNVNIDFIGWVLE